MAKIGLNNFKYSVLDETEKYRDYIVEDINNNWC